MRKTCKSNPWNDGVVNQIVSLFLRLQTFEPFCKFY
jgi:hypothetical protein